MVIKFNGDFGKRIQTNVNGEQTKPQAKEVKEEIPVGKTPEVKEVKASALEATAAQIWGIQLSKVDKSDEATFARLEKTMPKFLTGLDKEFGYDTDITAQLMAFAKGCDPDKLNRHMQKPVDETTTDGIAAVLDFATV